MSNRQKKIIKRRKKLESEANRVSGGVFEIPSNGVTFWISSQEPEELTPEHLDKLDWEAIGEIK